MKKVLYTVCLVLVLALSSPGYCINHTVFDVIGDSISAGVNPDTPGSSGWVQMLFGEFGSSPDTIDSIWPGITKTTTPFPVQEPRIGYPRATPRCCRFWRIILTWSWSISGATTFSRISPTAQCHRRNWMPIRPTWKPSLILSRPTLRSRT